MGPLRPLYAVANYAPTERTVDELAREQHMWERVREINEVWWNNLDEAVKKIVAHGFDQTRLLQVVHQQVNDRILQRTELWAETSQRKSDGKLFGLPLFRLDMLKLGQYQLGIRGEWLV